MKIVTVIKTKLIILNPENNVDPDGHQFYILGSMQSKSLVIASVLIIINLHPINYSR